jgi:polyhydroxyalkanoate synthesis repressor PhaR
MRIIKRYSNRKLYDTGEKHYVTLRDVARIIRQGDTVSIVDKDSTKDLTTQTLAQILYVEELADPKMSAAHLHTVIRERAA